MSDKLNSSQYQVAQLLKTGDWLRFDLTMACVKCDGGLMYASDYRISKDAERKNFIERGYQTSCGFHMRCDDCGHGYDVSYEVSSSDN